MTAKAYLLQLTRLRHRIRWIKDEIDALRAEAESVRGIRYDKIRVQTSPDPDPLASYFARLEKEEQRLVATMDKYIEIRVNIEQQLADFAPGMYADILYLRYAEGMTLQQIADEMNYSYDYVRHAHGHALQAFERKYL